MPAPVVLELFLVGHIWIHLNRLRQRHEPYIDAPELISRLPRALRERDGKAQSPIWIGLALHVDLLKHSAGSQSLELRLELGLSVDSPGPKRDHLKEHILGPHSGPPPLIEEQYLRELVPLEPAELVELDHIVGRQAMGVPFLVLGLISNSWHGKENSPPEPTSTKIPAIPASSAA